MMEKLIDGQIDDQKTVAELIEKLKTNNEEIDLDMDCTKQA